MEFPSECSVIQDIYKKVGRAREGAGLIAVFSSVILSTRYVKNLKRPRSGLVVMPSGGGKTDVLNSFLDTRRKIIEPASRATAQGLLKCLPEKYFNDCTWLVSDLTVYLEGLSEKSRIEFLGFLAKYLEDGVYTSINSRESFERKGRLQVLFGCTDEFLKDQRKAFRKTTAYNRLVPFHLTYDAEQKGRILEIIQEERPIEPLKFNLKRNEVIWPRDDKEIREKWEAVSMLLQQGRSETMIGRAAHDMKDLCMGCALLNGRNKVTSPDLEVAELLSPFMVNPFFFTDNTFKITCLMRADERAWTARELANQVGVSERTAEKHLSELRKTGTIKVDEQGNGFIYSL